MTIDWLPLVLLALGTYRLTRLIVEDVILDRPRNAFWRKFPPERSALGYLLTCYWCVSLWVAAFMILLYVFFPVVTLIAAAVLAVSAVVGIIDHLMNR